MTFSLSDVRDATPGVANVAHLNNAGSALPPTVVVDTMVDFLRREAAIGGYEAKAEALDRLEAVYGSIGALIGVPGENVAVVENATRAWDMAVYGFPFKRGDRVLTGRSEYASNVIALLQLRDRHGIEIVLIGDDETGQISLEQLESELEVGAAMVALTHVATSGGLVNPAQEVGQLCRRYDTCFVLDACQSVGQVPIDVASLGCDVLSATGRKFLRGPRGTGFLYVATEWIERIEPPLLDLHAATWTSDTTYSIEPSAKRFENWETNFAGKLGLGAAAEYAIGLGVDETWQRAQQLGAQLRDALSDMAGVAVHDKGKVKGAIVTFSVEGVDAHELHATLQTAGVNTSVSVPEYARFDTGARNLGTLMRASPHYYNTEDELGRLLEVVQSAAG